jgi:hypothetical protein
MGVRPDAPTIETIVPVTFYEIINDEGFVRSLKVRFFVTPAKAGIQYY